MNFSTIHPASIHTTNSDPNFRSKAIEYNGEPITMKLSESEKALKRIIFLMKYYK